MALRIKIVPHAYDDKIHQFLARHLTYENVDATANPTAADYARRHPQCTYVAQLSHGRIVGVICTSVNEVLFLAVHGDYRRRQIGQRLVRHVLEYFKNVFVLPEKINTRGIEFYKKLGFVEQGACPCKKCKDLTRYVLYDR